MKKLSLVLLALLIGTVFISYFMTTLSSNDMATWIKYSGNPLDLGLDRVGEPWVIYDGLMFKMWYTGITDHHGIYYATSLDGVNWTPYGIVLDIGESGSWEGLAVGRPVVLLDGIIYKMWYMGHDGVAHRIGYATSMDGINWIKYEANPVLVPGGNGGWDDGGLGEFTVTFDGTLYRMWYNGQAYMHATLKIGVATSPDGISWTKYAHNPVLVPGSSGWDSYHIYTGPVIKKESSYLMWYSGQQFPSTVRIGLATSSDGFSWSKYEANPVIDTGSPGTWDSAGVFAGAILEEDDKLLMWYWGNRDPAGGTERIGLATYTLAAEDVLSNTIDDFKNLEEVLEPMDAGAYSDVIHQYLEPALSFIVEDNYVYIDDQDSVKKGETALDMLKEAVDKIQNNFLDPGTLDPENTTRLEAIQESLVKVAEILAKTLLEDLEKAGLTAPVAIEEYDKGKLYFSEAPNQATYGEQIAKYKDAWKQGVKVLELQWKITSGIARPP